MAKQVDSIVVAGATATAVAINGIDLATSPYCMFFNSDDLTVGEHFVRLTYADDLSYVDQTVWEVVQTSRHGGAAMVVYYDLNADGVSLQKEQVETSVHKFLFDTEFVVRAFGIIDEESSTEGYNYRYELYDSDGTKRSSASNASPIMSNYSASAKGTLTVKGYIANKSDNTPASNIVEKTFVNRLTLAETKLAAPSPLAADVVVGNTVAASYVMLTFNSDYSTATFTVNQNQKPGWAVGDKFTTDSTKIIFRITAINNTAYTAVVHDFNGYTEDDLVDMEANHTTGRIVAWEIAGGTRKNVVYTKEPKILQVFVGETAYFGTDCNNAVFIPYSPGVEVRARALSSSLTSNLHSDFATTTIPDTRVPCAGKPALIAELTKVTAETGTASAVRVSGTNAIFTCEIPSEWAVGDIILPYTGHLDFAIFLRIANIEGNTVTCETVQSYYGASVDDMEYMEPIYLQPWRIAKGTVDAVTMYSVINDRALNNVTSEFSAELNGESVSTGEFSFVVLPANEGVYSLKARTVTTDVAYLSSEWSDTTVIEYFKEKTNMGRLIQNPGTFDYINTGDAAILSGDPVIVGEIVGIAVRRIEPGELGALSVEGIYELEKDTAAITLGAAVYVNSAGKATATSTSAVKAGYAVAEAAASDATVKVMLR